MKKILFFLLVLLTATGAHAALQSGKIVYSYGGVDFVGYMAWDDSFEGKRPGVLVIHEWWGLNDFARARADQLAGMGYVAFAADMYGGGKATDDRVQAAEWAKGVRGTPLMRDRALAGLQVLTAHERVAPGQVAAIGFCFGGTGVLELAYSGAEVAGVVSFHGGLSVPSDEEANSTKARILILHGAADPYIEADTIDRLQKTLGGADVDWQMIYYSQAVHSFTNPDAGDDPSKGSAYDARAAERSWKHMQVFFEEIFSEPGW
jgi:dienelactone hydrolase